MARIRTTVDGQVYEDDVEPRMLLVQYLRERLGKTFFDLMDGLSSNWMLPLGGLLIALYVGWALRASVRDEEFSRHTPTSVLGPWLAMLRVLSPLAVAVIMMRRTGLLQALGLPL